MSSSDNDAVKIEEAIATVIRSVTEHFAGIDDPIERARATGAMLNKIPHLQGELRSIRQGAVLELRRQDYSHADVAAALGISRAQAQSIAQGRTSGSAERRRRERDATSEDDS